MFIPNDGITEIVAHFIGYFEVRAEDLRYRSDFDRFSTEPEARPVEGDVDPARLDFHQALNISRFVPEVAYTPPTYAVAPAPLKYSVSFDTIPVPMPDGDAAPVVPVPQAGSAAPMAMPSMHALAPGSTIAIVSQITYLMDDDVLVVGDHEFDAAFRLAVHAEVEGLAGEALAVSAGLDALTDLRSVTKMVDMVEDASVLAQGLHEDDFGPLDSLFLKVADRIDGHYSNGVETDAPVTLEEALAPVDTIEEEEDGEPPQTAALTIDAATTPTTMNVSSGGNVSWNEAAIVNAGLPSGVVTVAGDYHRIDAIYQTNVLRDIDTIDGAWPAENVSIGGNVVQNSASFVNQSQEERTGDTSDDGGGGGFPKSWNVTTIDGDMTFLSWVQQYSFTSDNDTQILTAMGTNTYLSSGLNLAFNTLGFVDLGLYFDLVFIGGSLYDGNFITQTNVLLDSDKLDVEGTSSAWKGSAATGENMLWNEARIENVGPDEWTQGLPSHYREAADGLAAGDTTMPDGFKGDGALDGLAALKVLYIAGNVYDIHSISQVNVVGDADDLTVYEASLLKAQDSVWQVSTGHNLLVNKAGILDYDGLGKSAYVGGEIYSDAILVQADIVDGLTDRLTVRGDALANEVIAFLDDTTDMTSRLDDHPAIKMMTDAGAAYDLMHSVLA